MILGILKHAIGRLMAAGAGVIAHAGRGHSVGIHAVLADNEDTRMHGLGTQDPWTLAADHGDDAVSNREVDRPGPENIYQNSRQPPSFVTGRLRIEFDGSARRRLRVSVVEDLLPVAIYT